MSSAWGSDASTSSRDLLKGQQYLLGCQKGVEGALSLEAEAWQLEHELDCSEDETQIEGWEMGNIRSPVCTYDAHGTCTIISCQATPKG